MKQGVGRQDFYQPVALALWLLLCVFRVRTAALRALRIRYHHSPGAIDFWSLCKLFRYYTASIRLSRCINFLRSLICTISKRSSVNARKRISDEDLIRLHERGVHE